MVLFSACFFSLVLFTIRVTIPAHFARQKMESFLTTVSGVKCPLFHCSQSYFFKKFLRSTISSVEKDNYPYTRIEKNTKGFSE